MNGTQQLPHDVRPAATPYPQPVSAAGDPRRKSPALACLLSLIPGLGQIYVGYYQRGFVHAIVAAAIFTVLVNSGPGEMEIIPLFAVLLVFFFLYNVIDAGRKAALYNLALEGREQIDLPGDFKMPNLDRFGGSIPAGLALLLVGAALLGHTRFDYSLAWVKEWWPASLMLVGAWLVGRAVFDRLEAGKREGAD